MADTCKPDQVLVVDDEAYIRQIIIRVLEQRGYQVKEAANGAQALELLRETPFDLVITDLRMPQMEGLELLERARELYPETDFIILTAHGTIESAVWAMQRGADDYLTKPCDVRDLELKALSGGVGATRPGGVLPWNPWWSWGASSPARRACPPSWSRCWNRFLTSCGALLPPTASS